MKASISRSETSAIDIIFNAVVVINIIILNIATHMSIARQRLGKHIFEVTLSKAMTYIARVSRSSARTLQVNRIEEMEGIYLLTRCYKPPKLK
jgi:hypothetical protein